MSSTPAAVAATTAAVAATTAAVERQTYWCHECDMSVSLLSTTSTSSSLLCPHCDSDFLEQMDSPLFNPIPNPNLSSSFPILSPHRNTPSNDDDDNYLLDSPYLHRLIHHLTNSQSENPFTSPILSHHRHNFPASKSAVESIPTIKITASLLDLDPILLCAVCKDQFPVDAEAKQLPCKHMYHSDCILPWLSQHNSCPVCRFRLPAESDEDKAKEESRWRSRLVAVEEEEEDLFGFESTLRHIARRHRAVFADLNQQITNNVDDESREAEAGVMERANSVETVSSWPRWVIDGGDSLGGGGGGDGDIGVTGRLNDDDDDNNADSMMY